MISLTSSSLFDGQPALLRRLFRVLLIAMLLGLGAAVVHGSAAEAAVSASAPEVVAAPAAVSGTVSAAAGEEEFPLEDHLAAAGIPVTTQYIALGVLVAAGAVTAAITVRLRRSRREQQHT